MSRTHRVAALLSLAAIAAAASSLGLAQAPPSRIDLNAWKIPAIEALPDSPDSRLIRHGHALVTETFAHIGPEVPDPAKRFAGNNLSCQSCHLNGGSQAFAMPYLGVWGSFPQYRARENEVSTIEERVNGCMERSMNGRPLPLDSPQMKAMLAYFRFMSTGVPVGGQLIGAGTTPIREPDRAADPQRGAKVYEEQCAVCHGADGLGVRNGKVGDAKGYQFPPLWGPDSYNTGAGMSRLLTAAAFVRANMPFGVTHKEATLSDDDAYDVAAYVNAQPRPVKPDLDKDFPDRSRKPVDAAFPPYVQGFSAEQHRLGPFNPIRAKLRELNEAARKKN
ncbi:MAG: c-type cytochrome [Methylobacteriaceae bacterium]|nr:c-type cytochrome [Methylobacteriaceae bacterium]